MSKIRLPVVTLQWRHNDRDVVSNHQRLDCLLSRLLRRKSKKISKLCFTGLCEGNWPVTGGFASQMASNTKHVSIWWLHHDDIVIDQTNNLGSVWQGSLVQGREYAAQNPTMYCLYTASPWITTVYSQLYLYYRKIPNTLRNNDVVIASKRRHFDVITSKWRRFDVIMTLLLRHMFNNLHDISYRYSQETVSAAATYSKEDSHYPSAGCGRDLVCELRQHRRRSMAG